MLKVIRILVLDCALLFYWGGGGGVMQVRGRGDWEQ